MRYFVVQQESAPVAVVFHDHVGGNFLCRSKTESFLSAFNAICEKREVGVQRDESSDHVIRAVRRGSQDYDWISNILDHLSGSTWSVLKEGTVINVEGSIDAVITEYLT